MNVLAAQSFDNVFVLGTGRCGTVTFSEACTHLSGWTSSHESRVRLLGAERLDYPTRHIEVDNRLSWFLGSLGRRFETERTLYVHLRRDRDQVVASFERRWHTSARHGIIRAFGHGVISRSKDWDDGDIRSVCETYVDTVRDNVDEFLSGGGRTSMSIDIEDGVAGFAAMADRIDTRYRTDAVADAMAVHHNASVIDRPSNDSPSGSVG